MTKPKTPKIPLSAEEIRIAARIKAAIANIPGLTEELVGTALGVTQGQISHWSNGRLRVPADRAADLARVLDIADPGELSIAFRKLQAQGVREPMATYGTPPDVLAELRRELDAMKAMVVSMLTTAATHRPIEASDVARRIRRHVHPALIREPVVAETLKTIDRMTAAATAPPRKAGGADR